ncbi:hypothetical protein [Chryseobacterium sp. JUb7]|uniref:hypothetical protein n=1 Tax=Chryseobacterium sp. JUb7 TaxID=2940599 RepID=UPI0021689B0F|nr:hypothetical protein [Chryseobacterium sp. JUb7]MCS3529099.1 hypothetical protein [Chryseobacterium sp. JUb7]
MKKTTLLLIAISISCTMYAQVGINTTTPGTTLDVNGAITNRETAQAITANAVTIQNNVSQVRLTGAATATIAITGSTPPNPGQRLIIYNNTTGGFDAVLNGAIIPNGQALEFAYSNASWVTTHGGNAWSITGNTGTNPTTNFLGTTDNQALAIRANNSEKMRVTPTGRVGIGTTNPTGRFEIVSDNVGGGAENNFYFRGFGDSKEPALIFTSANGTEAVPTNLAAGEDIGSVYFGPRSNNTYNVATGSAIRSRYRGDGTTLLTDLLFRTSNVDRMTIDETGNVGIATTAPASKLDIVGDTFGMKRAQGGGSWDNIWFDLSNTSAPTINASGAETGLQFNVGANAVGTYGDGQTLTTVATMRPNGNVGIGTAAPVNRLHVIATTAAQGGFNLMDAPAGTGVSSSGILRLRNTSAVATGNISAIGFSNNGATSGGPNWQIGSIRARADLNTGDDFFFASTNGATLVERMRINTATGNLGIGTTAPVSKLHVAAGDIYIENIGSGVIMKSDNGTCWRVRVNNSGAFTSASITCP